MEDMSLAGAMGSFGLFSATHPFYQASANSVNGQKCLRRHLRATICQDTMLLSMVSAWRGAILLLVMAEEKTVSCLAKNGSSRNHPKWKVVRNFFILAHQI